MDRHLHLVPSGTDRADPADVEASSDPSAESNVVDLDAERRRRRYRYHPAAGRNWLDDLFDADFDDDDDWDPLDPVC